MDLTPISSVIYSGRGISIGKLGDDRPFVAYTLTGRSPPSQARRLSYDEENRLVTIEVTDPEQLAKAENPALLEYDAIAQHGDIIVVSNGVQTDLLRAVARDESFGARGVPDVLIQKAMGTPVYRKVDGEDVDITSYEPDSNHTPRICGAMGLGIGAYFIVEKGEKDEPVSRLTTRVLETGKAHFISTYDGGNEKPILLPFQGGPREMEVRTASVDELASEFFDAIPGGQKPEDNYQVAAAVMALNKDGSIDVAVRNRF